MGKFQNLVPGINHVGAYQVSGKPFASGAIEALVAGPVQIIFPGVTSWLYVINRGGNDCKVAYSKNGLLNTNYFVVPASSSSGHGPNASPVLKVKVAEIWLSGSGVVDVAAGITYINVQSTKTDAGTSWSGSSGVG